MKKHVVAGLVAILLLSSTGVSAQSKIQDVKGPGGYSITAEDRFGKQHPALTFGGYADIEYTRKSGTSKFENHRLILDASARLNPRILFNAEIEFEHGGNELKIEQAWVDYAFSDAFVQRTGIVVIPFGRLNVLHDSDVRDLTTKGLYADVIVPSTWMDTGIGAHGVFDLGNMAINYEGYLVNGLQQSSKDANQNGLRKARPSLKEDNNISKAIVGRVGISPMLGLEVGTSVYHGKYDDADSLNVTMIGLDGTWKKGPIEVVGEFATVSSGVSAAHDNPLNAKMQGFYLEGRYHLTGEWLKNSVIGRGFKHPVVTLVGRYGEVDTDTSVTNAFDRSEVTVGVNYRPVPSLAYKLEYRMLKEKVAEVSNDELVASVAIGF